MGVFGMFAMCCKVFFAITERRDMCMYEVPLYVSLLGFVIWTMLANSSMCEVLCFC